MIHRHQAEKCTANSVDSYYDKCIMFPQMKSAVCRDTVTVIDGCIGLFSFPSLLRAGPERISQHRQNMLLI